jgi:transposase
VTHLLAELRQDSSRIIPICDYSRDETHASQLEATQGFSTQDARIYAAHLFRAVHIQVAHKSAVAMEALELIAALYAIEKEIQGRTPGQPREIRNTRSRPLLESLKQWLEEILGRLSKKSDTAMAVRYALGRGEALMRYYNDGRLEIDNNAAERALRAVALGRNYV